MRLLRLLVIVVPAAVCQPALAQKPVVPPGIDPGGVAVAVIGPGLDYTRRDIARRLARDGEGELIGWDLTDNDRRPYARGEPAGAIDREGARGASSVIRIVPVKADPPTAAMVSRGLAFAAQTPAQIAVVRSGAGDPEVAATVVQIARLAPRLLIVLDGPAPDVDLPDNVVAVVARAGDPAGADPLLESLLGAAPAWLATSIVCDDALRRLATGAELKAALIARASAPAGRSRTACR